MKKLVAWMLTLFLCHLSAAAIELHVSPQGRDDGLGSAEAPLASLARARDLIRETRAQNPESAAAGATVWIHGGVYEQAAPFVLESRDGGSPDAPVVYRAVPGDAPSIVGGKTLPPDAFKPVTDDALLARIDPAARASTLRVDLPSQGIADLGVFPSAFSSPHALPELFFNGTRMELARWPNGGEWATVAKVVDSGPAPWRNHESRTRALLSIPETVRPAGQPPPRSGSMATGASIGPVKPSP